MKLLIPSVMFALLVPANAPAAPDVSGKVVLANMDRYPLTLRIGPARRDVQPKTASVISPKTFPLTVEYWSGNTKAGWQKKAIASAGIYGFNFKRGYWSLAELKTRKTAPAVRPGGRTVVRKPARTITQQRIARPVRRHPINADRSRWHPLARAVWFAGSLYQFVRDEQDRDLLRHLLIHGRDKDWKDFEDWIRGTDKIAVPYKAEILDNLRELSKLSDADWKEIETADEADWQRAREDLGDLISDEEWKNISGDLEDVDTGDYWENDVEVDFDELDLADTLEEDGTLETGEAVEAVQDYALDDLDIDTEHYDLGDYDDFGGYDGHVDADPGDFDDGGDFGDDDFGDFGGFDDFDF